MQHYYSNNSRQDCIKQAFKKLSLADRRIIDKLKLN